MAEIEEERRLHVVAADASLGAWLAARESTQRWWAAALGAPTQQPLSVDELLIGQVEQRVGVAVTIRAADEGGAPPQDPVPPATVARAAEEEVRDAVDAAAAAARDTEDELDLVPRELWHRDEGAAVEAAVDDAVASGGGQRYVGAGLEEAWPLAQRWQAARLERDELAAWDAEARRAQETLDEALLEPQGSSAGGGQRVVVLNVTGLDEAEIADIAAGEYEQAQARRRFRAHVPG